MKTISLILAFLGLVSQTLNAQKLKYDNAMDSLWSKGASLVQTSANENWMIINEFSDFKANYYKVIHTKGLKSFNLGHCLSAEFSPNSQWVAFKTIDSKLEVLNLENGSVISLGNSKDSFKNYGFTPKENVLAYTTEEDSIKFLILRDLESDRTMRLSEVNDFVINPLEDLIIATKSNSEKNELQKIAPFKTQEILDVCQKCSYSQVKWNESGEFLTFLKIEENTHNQLFLIGKDGSKKYLSDESLFGENPKHRIGDWDLDISKDGKKVYFYRELINFIDAKEDVQIWNTDDIWIYPRLKTYDQKKRLLLTSWNAESGEILNIEDKENPSSYAHPDLPFALVYDVKKYEPQYEHYPYADIYLLDLNTGEKRLIINKLYTDAAFISLSPSGDYVCYFKDENWWLYNIRKKSAINLTKEVDVKWSILSNKRHHNPHLIEAPFWSEDNKFIILHDQYDVWKFGVDGIEKEKLTNGNEAGTSYHIYVNKNEKNNLRDIVYGRGLKFDLEKSMLLETQTKNLKTGFSIWYPNKKIEDIVFYEGNIDVLHLSEKYAIYRQSRYNESPEFYQIELDSKSKYLAHVVNPELKKYDLGDYKIFNYSTEKFQNLTGVLLIPANYDSNLKYPMIVWPYEKSSSYFYKYFTPSDYNYFDIYKYIHNGYFILLPDIEYEIGNPGLSALECVKAGVRKAVEITPQINVEKLGLIGHSFGGYEAAFIATQTNLFKAVVAGAAVTDFVSFYHDIAWEWETDQAWRLENQQFRMGDSYYNLKEEYQLNSPLFHVEKLETPLLLWTGKLDTNINWYQSVLMYSAMRRLKKEGKLLLFNNEGHSLVKPENKEKLSKEVYDWFELYLKKTNMN